MCCDEEITSPESPKKPQKDAKKNKPIGEGKDTKGEAANKRHRDFLSENDKIKTRKRDTSPIVDKQQREASRGDDEGIGGKRKRRWQQDAGAGGSIASWGKEPDSKKRDGDKLVTRSGGMPSSHKDASDGQRTSKNDKHDHPSATHSPSKSALGGGLSSSSLSKTSPSLSRSSEIISPPTLTTTHQTLTPPVTSSAGVATSSYSPSSNKPLASPSFIAMTPASQMTSVVSPSLSSSVVPFPSKLSGVPTTSQPAYHTQASSVSPAVTSYSSTSSMTSTPSPNIITSPQGKHQSSAPTKPPIPSQVVSKASQQQLTIQQSHVQHVQQQQVQVQQQGSIVAQPQVVGQQQKNFSRIGSILQVRCKAVTALLYASKYESGSKGKCILSGDEWLTPNEFEEKAGSKAKKYLSSIKCHGRPLRAYVNSGELRGVGPPPSSGKTKINKPKPPQPIAPAPVAGNAANPMGMGASLGVAPPMSPAHIPSNLSQSLPVMMGGVSQPILINQSSLGVANSMASGSSMQSQLAAPIITPMTFTLAPMSSLEVRQGGVGMGQQLHNAGQPM